MGGGKINKYWLDLDFNSPDAVDADEIPFDSTSSIKQKIDQLGGGGSGTTREIEYFTLTSTDMINKYITLSNNPIDIELEFTVLEGPEQQYQVDYVLKDNNKVSWSSSDAIIGLEGSPLTVGDVIRIVYSR